MSNLYGVDILRAFEVTWLNSHGKPEVALLEIFEDTAKPNTNCIELEKYLMTLYEKKFTDFKELRSEVYNYLKKNPHFGENYIKLTPVQDFFAIDFINIPLPTDLAHKVTQGLRFICEKTSQPYIGSATIYTKESNPNLQQQLNAALLELRNKKFSPRDYTNELFVKRFNQTIAQDFVLSITLNRRRGISMQMLRCRKSLDFLEYVHREVLE